MVAMLVVILIRPRRWLEGRPDLADKPFGWPQWLIFFAIGIYGGFIQAGVGIFLLAGLVLSAGYDLVRANAVKVLIVLVFTISALAVFVVNQQVVWTIGLIVAVGQMAGAWVAARMAVGRSWAAADVTGIKPATRSERILSSTAFRLARIVCDRAMVMAAAS